MKVHVLEGTDAWGAKVIACRRRARFMLPDALVGRAYVLDGSRAHEVTCTLCRDRYSLPALVEAAS